MHAEVPTIPPVIDVDAELDHWRRQHADGALPHNSFGSYVPWVKFACDSLITQPRASNAQRDEMFQTQYALQIMPRLSEAQAREFVDRCWQHVYQTSRAVRLQDAPRLRA
ncbi:TPA: hypothetical protein QDZ34_002705 [Stenotrophomonas maltophilia]|uniref:hypothetical protein n=1 Tax=Stenotrophomonas TaxID=40323 RepID=UPI0028ABBBCD|nr:hypothetical protein [Stenotrophomonas sp.]HDS0950310.1 hypothetical protein [Stenotrophomonas maltophilia]HDS1026580.1 hypothetical protein [Stenotrophomonas maltophilia]HDS1030479.1 hypothetical protein [Stenotrophomonas maltophilia]HDS1035343.1 hypothetical protein [Stenotrophomonas maltophilia]HDS1040292.1 hypothetical protein [Stenotrophomonas maltophilia]